MPKDKIVQIAASSFDAWIADGEGGGEYLKRDCLYALTENGHLWWRGSDGWVPLSTPWDEDNEQ